MDLDVSFFAFAIPAVLFMGVSKGGFGSGAGFAATPLLAMVIEPAQAVGLMLPLLMLMDVTGLKPWWRKWSWHHSRVLMAGSIPGVVLGALFFRAVSADGIRLMVGLIAIGFVAWSIARSRGWLRQSTRPPGMASGLFWGLMTGFTSFVSHAGGPPASMYMLGCRLDKTTYQATSVIVFWWVNLVKFLPYGALGMFTTQSLRADLMLAPVAVAGVMLGVWANRVIAQTWYFRLTYTLLLATGAKLVFDALS